MILDRTFICPDCGCALRYYDHVQRGVRTKGRQTKYVTLRRFQCPVCKKTHRALPDYIYPYKQYEAEIINGVREGFITCETLGYEDYPCEMTMLRWKSSRDLHRVL